MKGQKVVRETYSLGVTGFQRTGFFVVLPGVLERPLHTIRVLVVLEARISFRTFTLDLD